MSEEIEPVGSDPEVQAALVALERAMVQAARRTGHEMKTIVLLWCSDKDGDAYAGSILKGDMSEDVIAFLGDVLADDSDDVDLVEVGPRRH